MSTEGGGKAIIAALVANLGIAVAKLVGFVITGASSMLAESVHSLADTGNQVLLLLGRRRSTREADDTRPFGYGRERFFSAFVVALVLFSLGALFAIYEGVHKIQHPESVESVGVALGILAVALVLEGYSLRTAVVESNRYRGNRGWMEFIRRSKNPELPVLLLEDAGAMAGLIIAFVSVLLSWQVDPRFDGYGTLTIGLLLGVIASVLAVEMKSLLIGEAAEPEDLDAIESAISSSEWVDRLIHMRTEHLGPEEILVACKVAFDPSLDVAGLSSAIDQVEAAIRAALSSSALIYIEPDLDREVAR